jgi:hypothetical protein
LEEEMGFDLRKRFGIRKKVQYKKIGLIKERE